ncbi:MAG: BON domain-containing protein [Pirellulales bacterium]|nr:BON domain-containing protein [Pirellulales bacterium]
MDARSVRNVSVRFRGIAERATECLQKSPYLDVRRITCKWEHGVLFLRGRLSSYHRKQVAQETVARVEGVSQVSNEIRVD